MSPLSVETIERMKRYEATMLEKRRLEEELAALKELITPDLSVGAVVETGDGVFTYRNGKVKWKYSFATKQAEEELKARKKHEEQTGIAEAETGEPYLEYREKTTGA